MDEFGKDIVAGLSKPKKTLPSKYFYDAIGDKLFQRIMASPEYYLTRSEMEIFVHQRRAIVSAFNQNKAEKFQLVELGAGDGTKTLKLLETLIEERYEFEYTPIDISSNALKSLTQNIQSVVRKNQISPLQSTYFEALEELRKNSMPKIVLFLGSNLGNLTDEEAAIFMERMSNNLKNNDKVFLGLDKIKSKDIVLPAYNDKEGITKAFNFNLLDRINNELDGDFNKENFSHTPTYSEATGLAESFITSNKNQKVSLNSLNKSFDFHEGEKIQTETSRKYSLEILEKIIAKTSFEIDQIFEDEKEYFMNVLLVKR